MHEALRVPGVGHIQARLARVHALLDASMEHVRRGEQRQAGMLMVERDGKFLLVEEHTAEGLRLNQPAGHWERGETLMEAVRREALEETAHHVEPLALLGRYTTHYRRRDITYLRFAYICRVIGFDAERALDDGIVRAVWLTPEELAASSIPHRSPLVMRCVQDYLAGRRFPLDFVSHA